MYNESSMKSHIFWLKFRRVFLLILFTIIGTTIGVIISDYIVNILLFPTIFRSIIVTISATIFLSIALLLTANTGKEIEDGYWKISIYKTLEVISKKLDNLENKENNNFVQVDNISSTPSPTIVSPTDEISDTSNIEISEVSEKTESNSSNIEIIDAEIQISSTVDSAQEITQENNIIEKTETEIKSDSEQ